MDVALFENRPLRDIGYAAETDMQRH